MNMEKNINRYTDWYLVSDMTECLILHISMVENHLQLSRRKNNSNKQMDRVTTHMEHTHGTHTLNQEVHVSVYGLSVNNHIKGHQRRRSWSETCRNSGSQTIYSPSDEWSEGLCNSVVDYRFSFSLQQNTFNYHKPWLYSFYKSSKLKHTHTPSI